MLAFGNLFRSAAGKEIAACIAAFWTEVDDVVGTLDDLEVMLDDNDSVTARNKRIEGSKKLLDIVEMQACRGLVEDKDGRIVLLNSKVVSELYALVLAAGLRFCLCSVKNSMA